MSAFNTHPDLTIELQALQRRLAALEQAQAVHQYSTATRPAASTCKGAIVFNTTTGKHEGSDGTSWNPLW